MEWIKSLFRPRSAQQLMVLELEEARRSLLQAQSAKEYAEAMVSYHWHRIERLSESLEAKNG